MRAAAQGLAPYHCRYHVEHRARHGSHWRSSYRAAELKPYLAAVSLWLAAHRSDFYVKAALGALDGIMQSAGPAEIATRLRGVPPIERARVALARLRDARIGPERLLTIHLAVNALIEEDPSSHRVREFRIVQVAKAAHRLASGTHRRWRDENGNLLSEMHAYPRSSGRVLRYLGTMIERECELVAEKHLHALLRLKVARFGSHPAIGKLAGPTPFAGSRAR